MKYIKTTFTAWDGDIVINGDLTLYVRSHKKAHELFSFYLGIKGYKRLYGYSVELDERTMNKSETQDAEKSTLAIRLLKADNQFYATGG